MLKFASVACTIALLSAGSILQARADAPSCRRVELSDIGWTDVTATTAVTARVLTGLGYKPDIKLLSLPVTYMSMKGGSVDVFLGDWEPSGAPVIKPFLGPSGVERISQNLTGAKYTLAVPDYTFDSGLKSFGDIAHFSSQLDGKIYGIEPGNDGNALILGMIKKDQFGLKEFKLVESSEQGMLAEVARRVADKKPIVFLAWEPHPMNLRFHIDYLSGGDSVFGPNYGSATVNTIIRPGYEKKCPNVVKFLKQEKFDVSSESKMMTEILDQHEAPAQVAREFLSSHPDLLKGWLDGVTTLDGKAADAAQVATAQE